MMELQDVLTRLKEIKEEKKKLDAEECRLSSPCKTDLDEVPMILDLCRQAYAEIHPGGKRNLPEERRRYLFILLFLYSPRTLSGGKMGNGLRSRIASAMGVEPSNVSHYCTNILFYYSLYKDFRDDVNAIFSRVLDILRKK